MQFSQAIQGFTLSLGPNYAQVTVANYQRFLRQTCATLGDPDLTEITPARLRAYLAEQAESKSSATVQVYWKVLRSFFKWASVDLDLDNPATSIPAPKVSSKEIQPFSQDDVTKLLRACKTRRDKALVPLLLDTGLRISEACRLTIRDVNLETGTVTVIPFGGGRKSRGRQVYLGKSSRRALWTYLASRPDRGDPGAPLLATLNGKPLNRDSSRGILDRIAARAGVEGCHPHRFRHTFAIFYLRNGGDVFSLQRLLGHASLEMVRRYLALADSDLEQAHRRASPVDRLM